MFKKAFLSVILIILVNQISFGQGADIFGKLNVGVGLDYNTIDYLGSEVIYSPGGGMGIELGVIFPFDRFEAYFALGYQQNLALQYESSTSGGTNESSFRFNRKSAIGGAQYNFYFSDGKFRGIKAGGGMNYNIPGTYRLVENNNEFGDIKYKPSIGYHINLDFVFELNALTIVPGVRYRDITYNVKSYEKSNTVELTNDLKRLNGSGIDISISIIKKLN